MECTCKYCVDNCSHKPGWFKPGEPEKAAELMNMTLKEFFDEYLGVDWWEADEHVDHDVFILSPRLVSMNGGEMFPSNPLGRCVFLKDDRCMIHAAKPFECAFFSHETINDYVEPTHRDTGLSWDAHQEQVKELLGYDPVAEEYSFTDSLSNMLR